MSTSSSGSRDGPSDELIRKPNGNLQFRYDPDYHGPPISQALPLQDEAHGHKAVRAVFGGLLPEGDVRRCWRATSGCPRATTTGCWSEVGGDVAGAITLLPEARAARRPASRALDDERLASCWASCPSARWPPTPSEGIRLSLAGAQPKVPVIIDDDGHDGAADELGRADDTHPQARAGAVPRPRRQRGVLHGARTRVRAAGRAVREGATISGKPFLIVERYDRDLTTDPIRRLHQEDFCQALGLTGRPQVPAGGRADGRAVRRADATLHAGTRAGAPAADRRASRSTGSSATATRTARTTRCSTTRARRPSPRSTTSSAPSSTPS